MPDLSPVQRKITEWVNARAALRAIEELEHPDFTDRFGRVWIWKDGDLWTHDHTLAYPRDMIDGLGLPPEKLRGNPNYHRLCQVCRSQWTDKSPVSPRCRIGVRWYDVRDCKFYESEE